MFSKCLGEYKQGQYLLSIIRIPAKRRAKDAGKAESPALHYPRALLAQPPSILNTFKVGAKPALFQEDSFVVYNLGTKRGTDVAP